MDGPCLDWVNDQVTTDFRNRRLRIVKRRPTWDSNPDCAGFESAFSASWSSGAVTGGRVGSDATCSPRVSGRFDRGWGGAGCSRWNHLGGELVAVPVVRRLDEETRGRAVSGQFGGVGACDMTRASFEPTPALSRTHSGLLVLLRNRLGVILRRLPNTCRSSGGVARRSGVYAGSGSCLRQWCTRFGTRGSQVQILSSRQRTLGRLHLMSFYTGSARRLAGLSCGSPREPHGR